MKFEIKKNNSIPDFALNYTKNYVIPLLLILTLLAIFNAMQLFFFHTSASSIVKLLNTIFAKLLYFWYYLLLIFQISVYYKNYSDKKYYYWIFYNLISIVVFVAFHQVLSYSFDVFILKKRISKTIIDLLIDNPAVWIDIVIYILFLFLFYLLEFKKLIQEKELRQTELEMELVRTKLTELRVKIQPEFLFNTLNSISHLIGKKKNKEANRKLGMLSDFLRTTIYNTSTEESAISDEMKFLDLYTEIEQDAETENFSITSEIENTVSDALMPQFTIQQIVEEFVRSAKKCNSPVSIFLKIKKSGENIKLRIENKNPEIKNAVLKSDVIMYIQEQFGKLYGDAFNFTTSDGEKEEIVITFPCRLKKMSFEFIHGTEE